MARLAASMPSVLLLATGLLVGTDTASAGQCPAYLDHEFRKLHSPQTVDLCAETAGKPVLIVNTASHCGYTSQFEGLEALHQKYKGRGLVVIGFPSNDFNQEASEEAETADVCFINYGVTFTMLAPTPVKGSAANPVFLELNRQTTEPSWNFNKYLVGADGQVVQRFKSSVRPDSTTLSQAIEKLLP